MRRLARRLLTLCSTASLLACVAVCVLWWRSTGNTDAVMWDYYRWADRDGVAAAAGPVAAGDWAYLASEDGWLSLAGGSARGRGPRAGLAFGPLISGSAGWPHLRLFHARHPGPPARTLSDEAVGRHVATGWGPLRWRRWRSSDAAVSVVQQRAGVHARHWVVALALAVVPAFGAVRRCAGGAARVRRARRGLCVGCGYDLRASPGRCPECGAAAVAAAAPPLSRGLASPGGGAALACFAAGVVVPLLAAYLVLELRVRGWPLMFVSPALFSAGLWLAARSLRRGDPKPPGVAAAGLNAAGLLLFLAWEYHLLTRFL